MPITCDFFYVCKRSRVVKGVGLKTQCVSFVSSNLTACNSFCSKEKQKNAKTNQTQPIMSSSSHKREITAVKYDEIMERVIRCLTDFDNQEQQIVAKNWNDILQHYRTALIQLNVLYDHSSTADDKIWNAVFPESIPEQYRINVDALPSLLSVSTLDQSDETNRILSSSSSSTATATTNTNLMQPIQQHNQNVQNFVESYRKELMIDTTTGGGGDDTASAQSTSASDSGRTFKESSKKKKKKQKGGGDVATSSTVTPTKSRLVIRPREYVASMSGNHGSDVVKASKPPANKLELLAALYNGKGVKSATTKKSAKMKEETASMVTGATSTATGATSTTALDPTSRAYYVEHFQKSQKSSLFDQQLPSGSIIVPPSSSSAVRSSAALATATKGAPSLSSEIDRKVQDRIAKKESGGVPSHPGMVIGRAHV